ncbi:MAG: polysaccharide biosynthesis protein PslG [Abditibacteriota bacterium]|nr:polysaccharide biosynthesis protein PslG [Abditibacteriota bacterium]
MKVHKSSHRCHSRRVFLLPLSAALALGGAIYLPAAPGLIAPAHAQLAGSRPAQVSINGQMATVTPSAIVTRTGSVLVPLRGVLERLNANVNYVAADSRIEVRQGGKVYILRIGQKSAVVDAQSIPLTAAPQVINKSTYVPLRSLVELFGYGLEWDNAKKTVRIDTNVLPTELADHRAALKAAGPLGVTIDFVDVLPSEIPRLLDAAKAGGAGLIQTRFDWATVQPTKDAPFDWTVYDEVVRQAKARGLVVVGILGNSTKWASLLGTSELPNEWRFAAPKTRELPAFQTYVQKTVERFRRDVHAWQVWDNPASYKFRAAAPADYRKVVKMAVQVARRADPKAVIHAGEPGGLNLAFLNDFKQDGIGAIIDGVTLFPVSQWQPGIAARPEEVARPFAALTQHLSLASDRWIGGLSWPSIETSGNARVFNTSNELVRERVTNTFTPQSQADYLVRAATLSLAMGADKVFWDRLRDDAAYDVVEPINPEYGSGLLRRDFSPRPSFGAMRQLANVVNDKPFTGSISLGPDIIALVFDNGREGDMVAWSPSGRGKMVLGTEDPQVAGSLFVQTRADSQLLDSAGLSAGSGAGAIELSARPVWITKIGAQTAAQARDRRKQNGSKPLSLTSGGGQTTPGATVRATFGDDGVEDGLSWRKYLPYRGQAVQFSEVDGQMGLMTEIPPDIFRPADGKPFIFFDVDDDFLFFARGVPVTITVKLKKARLSAQESLSKNTGAFDIEYNSATGSRSTRWQEVEVGEGTVEYKFDIPDASFGNVNGYDFKINTFGSKQNLTFLSVTLQRKGA